VKEERYVRFFYIISYLRIQSYNVLNNNNCSIDWSFPLRLGLVKCLTRSGETVHTVGGSV
jgi:hypothetical protein